MHHSIYLKPTFLFLKKKCSLNTDLINIMLMCPQKSHQDVYNVEQVLKMSQNLQEKYLHLYSNAGASSMQINKQTQIDAAFISNSHCINIPNHDFSVIMYTFHANPKAQKLYKRKNMHITQFI